MSTTAPALFDAGRLDRRITLQARTLTQDEYGQVLETWEAVTDLWAAVHPLAGVERVQAAAPTAVMDTRFIIRWRADVHVAETRVLHDGRTYNIEAVIELGRREGLQLDAVWTESPAAAAAAQMRAVGA